MPVTAIILAAGRSSRFGSNKLVHPIDGKPMIQRIIDTVGECGFQETIVVTGQDAEAVEATISPDSKVEIVRNANFADGMAGSIIAGITASVAPSTGYLIVPGDMPYLTAATLIALADGSDTERLAACRGADGPEAPAFFGHAYRQDLMKLQGDRGAKALLQEHSEKVRLISASPEELIDIDEKI